MIKKKMTAQNSSVGADDGQSISQNSKTTIPDPDEKSNSPGRDLEELYRKMRRMSDPAYLHTVTLDELMDNVFEGKSAVIENLLYTERTSLPVRPKSASPSWWRRLPTMSVPGRICGDIKSIRGRYFTLRWKMIFSVSRAGCL
mgnify:CR=1 FL=1